MELGLIVNNIFGETGNEIFDETAISDLFGMPQSKTNIYTSERYN